MPVVVPPVVPNTTVSATAIFMTLVLTMLLPLGAGLFIDATFERFADTLEPISNIASSIALVVSAAMTLLAQYQAILGVFGMGAVAAATVAANQSFDDPDILVMVVVTLTVSMATLFPIAEALGRRQKKYAEMESRDVAMRRKAPLVWDKSTRS